VQTVLVGFYLAIAYSLSIPIGFAELAGAKKKSLVGSDWHIEAHGAGGGAEGD